MRIYADNAATTALSEKALSAMLPYFSEIYGNPSSIHYEGQRAKSALIEARRIIAECINGDEAGVYFTSGGSESDNQAIISAAYEGRRQGRNHIISDMTEHHAVLEALEKLRTEGFRISLLSPDANGKIPLTSIENAVDNETCLVSIMTANNETGAIQDIEGIGRLCKEKKIIFHTDAVGAAGHIPVDVKKMNIDMLSLSAHKFHGPKGTGVLYARRGIPLYGLIKGGAQERGKRAGTENVPGIAGMAAALSEACGKMQETSALLIPKRDRIIKELSEIKGAYLNGSSRDRLPSNINMSFDKVQSEALVVLLDTMGICASGGSACASGALRPSHVLTAMGRSPELASGSLRLSLSDDITDREADFIIKSVKEAVEKIRSIAP